MGELEYTDDDIMLERWLIAMSARCFFFRLLSSIPNSLPISSCSSKHDLAVCSLPRVPLLCPSHHASSATFFPPAWRDTWLTSFLCRRLSDPQFAIPFYKVLVANLPDMSDLLTPMSYAYQPDVQFFFHPDGTILVVIVIPSS